MFRDNKLVDIVGMQQTSSFELLLFHIWFWCTLCVHMFICTVLTSAPQCDPLTVPSACPDLSRNIKKVGRVPIHHHITRNLATITSRMCEVFNKIVLRLSFLHIHVHKSRTVLEYNLRSM